MSQAMAQQSTIHLVRMNGENYVLRDIFDIPVFVPEYEATLFHIPYAEVLDLIAQEDCDLLAWILPSGEIKFNREFL